jgi:hypothetical protein
VQFLTIVPVQRSKDRFCPHAQDTRPDLQHHSDRGKLAGVSFVSPYVGWCYMWAEGGAHQGSVVHFCAASTLEASIFV